MHCLEVIRAPGFYTSGRNVELDEFATLRALLQPGRVGIRRVASSARHRGSFARFLPGIPWFSAASAGTVLRMGTVTHFELTGDSVTTLSGFLSAAFGWEAAPSPVIPEYSIVTTGEGTGIDGAVMTSGYQSQPVIIWIEVENIVATLDAVVTAGGSARGDIATIPGQGQVGYVTDPFGTVYGIKQPES
jgi:predicted enzyme related to lactoylglutathione lyase